MPHLRHADRRARLWPDTRVGRAPDSEIVLDDTRASRDHALIRWEARGWTIRDLGGRNGTSVDGRILRPGEERLLATGMRVQFGGGETWEVEDLEPPQACALADGVEVVAWAGVLVLEPDGVVEQLPDGTWRFGSEVVIDRAEVEAGGRTWRLRLPSGIAPTEPARPDRRRERESPPDPTLPEVSVEVGGLPERPRVVIRRGAEVHDLGARVHNRVLAALVRERALGRKRGVPPDEAGWLSLADLATWLGVSPQQLYLQLWRLREQLDRAGPARADELIERRAGEIRLADVSLGG